MDSSNQQNQEPDYKYCEFVQSLASDLRGDISFIKGYSEYLLISDEFDSLNESQQESLGKISRYTDQVFDTLDTYFKLAKIESGLLLIDQVSVDLHLVLKDVLKELQTKIESQKQTLKINVPPNMPTVKAKFYEIYEIFSKLVETACLCSSLGEKIIISFSANDKTVQTTISAESCSEKSSERNFPPSFGKFRFIRRYVEQFGGEFGEESKEGKGSTVWFTLPIADESAKQE